MTQYDRPAMGGLLFLSFLQYTSHSFPVFSKSAPLLAESQDDGTKR